MVANTKLNLDINEIRAKLEINNHRQVTFPEMICQNIHETNISKWIASLLNPKEYKYALQFINVFLNQLNLPECQSGDIDVYSERILGAKNRIDVYVTTSEYIIGIEVKIGANETDKQTERYHEEIIRRCERDHKTPVEIYLKPSSNTKKHKCFDFRLITFKEILPELHKLSKSLPMDREHFILDEFITYLENGPERARFIDDLSKEQKSELKKYHTSLYSYITDYFTTQSNYIPIKKEQLFSKDGLGFFQLKRKESEWENIHFHYEILWTESHYLALNKKAVVAVHLELYSDKKCKEASEFFPTVMDDGITLFRREIEVDFTSIKKSQETLDKIITILDSKEVDQLGNIADECVKKLTV